MMLNTGPDVKLSKSKLLSTIGYQIDGKVSYALEGSIFMAGASVQWLRDNLEFFPSAPEIENLAKNSNKNSNVSFIPAFTGLGAPYWDPEARGAILDYPERQQKMIFLKRSLKQLLSKQKMFLNACLLME